MSFGFKAHNVQTALLAKGDQNQTKKKGQFNRHFTTKGCIMKCKL